MGQYEHRVFVCISGGTRPGQGLVALHAAPEKGAAAAWLKVVRVNHAGCMNQ
jgi:hypothetical protein